MYNAANSLFEGIVLGGERGVEEEAPPLSLSDTAGQIRKYHDIKAECE